MPVRCWMYNRHYDTESGYTPPKDRVAGLAFNRALSTLNEHLVIPSASNSHFTGEELNECLLYLSGEERYAESGLEDLACTREAPSADALLYRLKKLESDDAYEMLVDANDALLEELRKRGAFRKPVIAAIDLTDDPYYGEYNNRVRRGKKERGTNLFYTFANLHVVEHGRRVTIFEIPVHQLDDHAMIVEKLVVAAKARGIRVRSRQEDAGLVDSAEERGKDRVCKLLHRTVAQPVQPLHALNFVPHPI